MAKAHSLGPLFVQVTKFPYKWGFKIVTKGWTQEVQYPYRTSAPLLLRLPGYKALVFGRWSGYKSEEDALNGALSRRDLTYDDFTEEAGWTPPPDKDREEGLTDSNSRLGVVDGAGDVCDWQEYYAMAKASE